MEGKTAQKPLDRLIDLITPMVEPLGYEIVHIEAQTQRQKTLRVFIEHRDRSRAIGVDDCVAVTHAISEPLDAMPEVDAIFGGSYELEVSSPGIDRPLRKPDDYTRFSGQAVRIHVFRPLTAEEIGNPGYQQQNPKQKHFVGKLTGLRDGKIVLEMTPIGKQNEADIITIPLLLVSKANLEPMFDTFADKRSNK